MGHLRNIFLIQINNLYLTSSSILCYLNRWILTNKSLSEKEVILLSSFLINTSLNIKKMECNRKDISIKLNKHKIITIRWNNKRSNSIILCTIILRSISNSNIFIVKWITTSNSNSSNKYNRNQITVKMVW